MNLHPSDKISQYVTYGEAVRSATADRMGISNEPDADALRAMRYIALNIFDKVRQHLNGPLGMNSFYRSPQVNAAQPRASKDSQHLRGEAIDINANIYGRGTNKQIFDFIRENLVFDQMIWEFGDNNEPRWVHVSLVDPSVKGRANRKLATRAYIGTHGETIYVDFDLYPAQHGTV